MSLLHYIGQSLSNTTLEKLFSGNGKDFMILALKDGGVALTVALGTGKLDTAIDPDNVRFDDNMWHHVLVQRHSSEVSAPFLF